MTAETKATKFLLIAIIVLLVIGAGIGAYMLYQQAYAPQPAAIAPTE